ncbi:MAG: carbohydrate-binding domain-containing protein, partial [Clostridia bacterium]|nr:carbohydrate-binding domain-containing protein [Clostridia bacterium]
MKKLLLILLACALFVSYIALAQETAEDEAWKSNLGEIIFSDSGASVSGDGVSADGSYVCITKGGDYLVSGTTTNGMIEVISEEKVKLRLSNANITNTQGPAICFTNSKKSFITLEEGTVNTLTDSETYSIEAKATLFSNDTLEIKGNGTLSVTSAANHAIASDDDIIIENGIIAVTAAKDGFHANDDITISGGSITVHGANDAFESEGTFNITGGTFDITAADDAFTAMGAFFISGGTFNVRSSFEAIESKDSITIDGGSFTIYATDDGLNAANALTINGGDMYIRVTRGDAIDSNGTLVINGGNIIGEGAQMPEGGIDCDSRSVTINGGTLIAVGGVNSAPGTDSAQKSVLLGGASANVNVTIENSSGETIMSFIPAASYSNMVFSSEKLKTGETYTVKNDQTTTMTFTVEGAVTSAGGTAGGFGGFGGRGMGGFGGMQGGRGGDRNVRNQDQTAALFGAEGSGGTMTPPDGMT